MSQTQSTIEHHETKTVRSPFFGVSAIHSWECIVAFTILVAVLLLNFWAFLPMLKDEALYHSDFGFHLSVLMSLDETVKSGGNPLDFWYDTSPFGFALFRSYQNLPYLIIYTLYSISFHALSLDGWLRLSTVILAAIFPLSLFWSAKRLGFGVFDAAVAAMCGSLISEAQNFGLGLQNYTFGTGGMVTQLWAVVALGPALATSVHFLRSGEGVASALLWSFICFGSHVVTAAILVISVATFALIHFQHTVKRCTKYILALTALTSYQWLFIMLDGRYIHKSIVEPPYKYASHGVGWVLQQLGECGLMDANRIPSLTILLVFGVVCGAADVLGMWRIRAYELSKTLLWILVSFFLALTFLAGWEIWGPVFANTPVLRSLHMHRFIIAVNLFGVLLAAYGCGVLRALVPQRPALFILFTITLYAVLHPAWMERISRYQQAERWRAAASSAWHEDLPLQAIISTIKEQPRTFVHPGNHQTWTDALRLARMVPLHDILIAQGIPTMGGMLFHAFSLAGDTMFHFSATRESTLKLFGVGLLLAPKDLSLPPFLTPLKTAGRYSLYKSRATRLSMIALGFNVSGDRNDEPGFMQRWVGSPLLEQNVFGVIDGAERDLAHVHFSDPIPTPTQARPTTSAQILEGPWKASGISAETSSEEAGTLMFKTGYHPNWSAQIDGMNAHTKWVTPGFVAIDLPPGKHVVSFTYKGSALKVVLFLSALAIIFLLFSRRSATRFLNILPFVKA